VIVSIGLGERPAVLALIGIVVALVAIVLVSQPAQATAATPAGSRAGIPLALMSGVAIGVFFLCLARTSPEAGLWPLLAARVTSVSLFAVAALLARPSFRMPAPVLAMVIGCGALDMFSNMLYLIATRGGSLSVIVTLTSLYPASTVVLARVILGERLSAVQGAGIACAFVAVLLIVGS
jgi:drug/metabolite transporter (DMT)-like permease